MMASSVFSNPSSSSGAASGHFQDLDPDSINMVILWTSTGDLDIYHANMTVNTLKKDEAKPVLDALRIHGVTIVEMD